MDQIPIPERLRLKLQEVARQRGLSVDQFSA